MSEPGESSSRDPFGLCGITIQSKYRITSVVGAGGFGVVYRGVHTGFGEPIAVKCLKLPSELGENERDALMSRLQDEGRVLHRLSKLSSGIVQALDVGAVTTDRGTWVPYLVLEWLEGETIADYLARRMRSGEGPLSLAEAIALLEPAARALEVAHGQRVAHRDVKPENLYLTEVAGPSTSGKAASYHRTVKVLDFGIAKVLADHATFTAAPAATQKNPTAFTPSYGAPEQFNKKRGATGPWTDVFALALIVVELVTGERALQGDDATQLYIAAADPAARPTLRHHGIETSDAVERVLARALAIEPSDRYQDVGTFWDALCEAAGEKPKPDPAAIDVSDTGEFLDRHDLTIEDRPAAATRREGSDRPPVRVERPDTDVDGDRPRSDRPPSEPPRPRFQRPSSERPEQPSFEQPGFEQPRFERPSSERPRMSEPVAPPAKRTAWTDETRPPAETIEPATASRWILPVVVVLALVGAALVYFELRSIGPSETSDRERGEPIFGPPTHDPTGNTTATVAPTADPDEDAGIEDAAADADDDAGDAATFDPPPAGMVFVPLGDHGFFLDQHEVTTAEYRQCVMASRCLPATRIALTPDAARALSVIPDDDDSTTPEQLAEAWGSRCNELRDATDHPVNCVNHAGAIDYCRFVDKRLPTSEEWQQAASGGGRRFPWGDLQPACDSACYGLNGSCVGSARRVATCSTGARTSDTTPEKVFDLAGNVSEWVSDTGAKKDPHGPPWRLLRGGSFVDEAGLLMASREVPPATAHVTIGFRCAQDAPEGYVLPEPEEEP